MYNIIIIVCSDNLVQTSLCYSKICAPFDTKLIPGLVSSWLASFQQRVNNIILVQNYYYATKMHLYFTQRNLGLALDYDWSPRPDYVQR